MIEKIISKIYVNKDNRNKAVAEVIENPGCGFEYLIRIDPEYKYDADIFIKCFRLCNIGIVGLTPEIIDDSFNKGYFSSREEIALICDKLV